MQMDFPRFKAALNVTGASGRVFVAVFRGFSASASLYTISRFRWSRISFIDPRATSEGFTGPSRYCAAR